MSLATTKWVIPAVPGLSPSIDVDFGANQATAPAVGGMGTYTSNYTSGPVALPIMWVEMPDGRFMFQMQGPTATGVDELPTYSGQHGDGSATGWATNFDAAWSLWTFTMTKKS